MTSYNKKMETEFKIEIEDCDLSNIKIETNNKNLPRPSFFVPTNATRTISQENVTQSSLIAMMNCVASINNRIYNDRSIGTPQNATSQNKSRLDNQKRQSSHFEYPPRSREHFYREQEPYRQQSLALGDQNSRGGTPVLNYPVPLSEMHRSHAVEYQWPLPYIPGDQRLQKGCQTNYAGLQMLPIKGGTQYQQKQTQEYSVPNFRSGVTQTPEALRHLTSLPNFGDLRVQNSHQQSITSQSFFPNDQHFYYEDRVPKSIQQSTLSGEYKEQTKKHFYQEDRVQRGIQQSTISGEYEKQTNKHFYYEDRGPRGIPQSMLSGDHEEQTNKHLYYEDRTSRGIQRLTSDNLSEVHVMQASLQETFLVSGGQNVQQNQHQKTNKQETFLVPGEQNVQENQHQDQEHINNFEEYKIEIDECDLSNIKMEMDTTNTVLVNNLYTSSNTVSNNALTEKRDGFLQARTDAVSQNNTIQKESNQSDKNDHFYYEETLKTRDQNSHQFNEPYSLIPGKQKPKEDHEIPVIEIEEEYKIEIEECDLSNIKTEVDTTTIVLNSENSSDTSSCIILNQPSIVSHVPLAVTGVIPQNDKGVYQSDKENTPINSMRPEKLRELYYTTDFKAHCNQCYHNFTSEGYIKHFTSTGNCLDIKGQEFLSKLKSEPHIPKGDNFYCFPCDKPIKCKSRWDEHTIRKHWRRKDYSCGECHAQYYDISELKRHVKKHSEERPFSCQYCDYRTRYDFALKKHWRRHSGPHKCELCSKGFISEEVLDVHKKTMHDGTNPAVCPICKIIKPTKLSLHLHMVRHGEKKVRCPHCPMRFYTLPNLDSHLKKHTGHKPKSCEFCPFKTTTRFNLKQHWLSHKGDVKCDFCPKRFLNNEVLDHHMSVRHKHKAGSENKRQSSRFKEKESQLTDDSSKKVPKTEHEGPIVH